MSFSWHNYEATRLNPPEPMRRGYERDYEPEPELRCAQCVDTPYLPLWFGDDVFCEECFTNNLCGWAGQIWPLAA